MLLKHAPQAAKDMDHAVAGQPAPCRAQAARHPALLLGRGTTMGADPGATTIIRSAAAGLGFIASGKAAQNGYRKYHPRNVVHWFSPRQAFWPSKGLNRLTAPRLRAETGQRRRSRLTHVMSRMRPQQRWRCWKEGYSMRLVSLSCIRS